MQNVLVIVPCGRKKIWDKDPERGLTIAAEAYTGGFFTLNRAYAERFGDAWMILSAKYGFIGPTFEVPEPYEVTFNRRSTNPVSLHTLQQQANELGLHQYEVVVGLGGSSYREAISYAFAGYDGRLVFPFAGLPIGRMQQATRQALQTGVPGID